MTNKLLKLQDFTKGWLVGDIEPALFQRKDIEVAIKNYSVNDYERSHHHLLTDEYTIIVSGEVEMNGVRHSKGDIVLIEKGESTDFKCLTDVITVVIRTGSFPGDKYLD